MLDNLRIKHLNKEHRTETSTLSQDKKTDKTSKHEKKRRRNTPTFPERYLQNRTEKFQYIDCYYSTI